MGHGQVDLSSRHVDVAKVCGKQGQANLDVRSLAVPGDQTKNSEGGPEVVQSWLPTFGFGTPNSGVIPQAHERILKPSEWDCFSGLSREEGRAWSVEHGESFAHVAIPYEGVAEIRTDRDQPRFEELRVPNPQNALT